MKKQFLFLCILSAMSARIQSQTAETEPNNSISDAGVQTITSDGSYNGSFSFTDLEYYKLAPGISGSITVTFTNAPAANGLFLAVAPSGPTVANTSNPGSFNYVLNPAVNYMLYTGTGTATGAWKFSIAGLNYAGAALQFDGVNDYVNTGNAINTALDPLNKLTVEAWVNPSTTSGLGTIIGNYGSPPSAMQFLLRRDADEFTFWVDDGTGFKVVSSGVSTVTINTWQHVAGVWNGSELLIYINGVLKATTTGVTGSSLASTSNAVTLGYNNLNENFSGSMDEVRIWSTARSQCDILSYKNCEIPTSATGLLANYHFNQGAANASNPSVGVLNDASGNAYHATLNNFALSGSSSNWITPGAVTSGFSSSSVPNVEIDVKGNGTSISTNDMTPSLTDHTDFGSACIQSILTRTFTIQNTGTSALSLNSGTLSGPDAATFTLSTLPTSIAASSSATCSINFSATMAGAKNATVTLTSSDCDEDYYTFAITASVVPTPTISVNSGAICAGQSFTLSPSGAYTYTYSSGSAIVFPGSDNSYSITGTSAEGCISANTAISSVTVNNTPTITVNSGTLCSGQSFTMIPLGAATYTYSSGNANVSPMTLTSYSVSGTSTEGCISSNVAISTVSVNLTPTLTLNQGVICSGESFTLVPLGADTYTYSSGSAIVSPVLTTTYSVTGTSIEGCQASNIALSTVSVNATPTISVNSGTICTGETFTIIPNGAATYSYSGGSDIVSPLTNSSYSITGTSAEGCISQDAAISSITVNVLPTITVNSGTICAGQSFTLTPGGANTYTYSGGSSIVTPTSNTTYSVSGTDANGCVSMVNAMSSVTVQALPTLTAVTNNTLLCTGESALLTTTGALTYTWSTTETTQTITVSPSVTTTYSVTGMDGHGCTNQTFVIQGVSPCLGVHDLNNASYLIQVYPNPTDGVFFLEVNMSSQLILTNMMGQVLKQENVEAGKHRLDIQEQAHGIYFLKVIYNNHQETIKMIKQ